jgi:fatty acid-binding protein DegV
MNKITERIVKVLNIKLIMGSDDGDIALHAKVRGRNQMLEKLVSFIASSGKETEGESMVITHNNNYDLAKQLSDMITERYNFKEILLLPTRGLSSLYADDQGIIVAF